MNLFGIECLAEQAQKVHQFLLKKKLLSGKARVSRTKQKVVFPLKKKLSAQELKELKKKVKGARQVQKNFVVMKEQPRNLKDSLKGKLSVKELSQLISSFDTVGNIAVIEIPEELNAKEKEIGEALLKLSKSIKTVCRKQGQVGGEFRVLPVKVIAGEKNTVADYKESGCSFRVSLGKVFFSPRLGTERKRIAKQIKKGEVVGALFAGVGPFPIVFAKNSGMKKAFAVELNPVAFEELKENIALNKVQEKVEPILGDVREIAPAVLREKCDRVVMPLPKDAGSFLWEAIQCIKPSGGIIHFYHFANAKTALNEAVELVKNSCANAGKKCRILRKKQVRSFSPAVIQVVVDFKVG